ncbi:hypothetical protein NHJ13734_005106 [Beauveria thailandica]
MAAQFVWINGLPGVGKLTVARALCALLPSAQLNDNHSLLDQVSLPRTHASYNAERARVRDAAYSSALYPRDDDDDAQLARVVIFTGALLHRGHRSAQSGRGRTTRAGRPFFLPVDLTCERGENLRRVVRPERGAAGSSKLTDAALVESFMEDSHIYRFPGLGVEIDTTARGPEETAQVEELRA